MYRNAQPLSRAVARRTGERAAPVLWQSGLTGCLPFNRVDGALYSVALEPERLPPFCLREKACRSAEQGPACGMRPWRHAHPAGGTMFPALNTVHRRHNLSCLIPRRAGDEGKQSQQMRLRAILWGTVFSSSHCEGQKEPASISICRRRRFPGLKSAQKSDFCDGAFND